MDFVNTTNYVIKGISQLKPLFVLFPFRWGILIFLKNFPMWWQHFYLLNYMLIARGECVIIIYQLVNGECNNDLCSLSSDSISFYSRMELTYSNTNINIYYRVFKKRPQDLITLRTSYLLNYTSQTKKNMAMLLHGIRKLFLLWIQWGSILETRWKVWFLWLFL